MKKGKTNEHYNNLYGCKLRFWVMEDEVDSVSKNIKDDPTEMAAKT